MPEETILDVVNNNEALYNDLQGLYRKWYLEGEDWSRRDAMTEALALAKHFADSIGGGYRESHIKTAAREMMGEYAEFKRYHEGKLAQKKKAESEETALVRAWEHSMTPEQVAVSQKNEDLARSVGFHLLKNYIPASPEQIRKALEKGDLEFASIPLQKWEQAAKRIPYMALPDESVDLNQKISLLKHFAAWHYP